MTETPIDFGHVAQSRQAVRIMKRVMSVTIAISSAIWMKMLGGIAPFSGCVQRDSASQQAIRDPSGTNIGW
ncbi:hypothetical protein D3C72_2474550 [compost metagenome]